MQILRKARHGAVQRGLFAGTGPAERFALDPVSRELKRFITRSDPDAPPAESIVGRVPLAMATDDLRSVADQLFLGTTSPLLAGGRAGAVRVADLFCGAGAMSLGIQEACRALGLQFEAVAGFDIDPRISAIYRQNFGVGDGPEDLSQILQSDLDAPFDRVEAELKERLGSIDIAVAGPPCQGHSNLNNQTRRHDPKNELYFLMARFAQLVRPGRMIVENVISVRNDANDVVGRTSDALRLLGYDVQTGVVDLWSIGVAQMRRRHVLVATLPTLAPGLAGTRAFEDFITPYQTRPRSVEWAIGDLLNVGSGSPLDQGRVPDSITQARIDYLFDNNLYDLPDSQRPDCHRSKKHTYGSVYGRMRWDEPAPTITGGFATMGQGRFVHPRRRRTITPHEAARLQFIPDYFDFSTLGNHRRTLCEVIGNAVPPKLSYVLAVELMR